VQEAAGGVGDDDAFAEVVEDQAQGEVPDLLRRVPGRLD
jgi:hypothetical protein